MMLFIYFVIVVSFIDTMAQLPILSPFVSSLGASALLIGIIMGAYSFSNMLGNLGAGLVIDQFGRKVGIVGGMLVAGVAVMLYAWVTEPTQLLWLRILHGIGGAILIPAAFTYAGDLASSRTSSTAKSMGYAGAAVGIAALLGPMLAGIGKERFGYESVFLAIGSILVVTAILAFIFLKETYSRKESNLQKLTVEEFKRLLYCNKLKIAYLSGFSLMFSMGVLAYAFPLNLESIGFTSKETGLLFSVFSIVAIIVFLLPVNRLSDYYGRYVPLAIGFFVITITLTLLPFAKEIYQFIMLMIFYGCGFGLIFPAMTAIIVDETDTNCRGTTFGIFYAAFSLGVFLGPIVGGMSVQFYFEPFWSASIIFIFVQWLFYNIKRKISKT
ncbi:MFS transporter [Desulfuribacillus alkaliarsenatis]|uniref:Major facilitator superfamily (MFS) profile domain-containing protein n=1 Tax=Desulfuribacillus alkaliarsenatis TaxID=766136 RepID=A0A1E5G0H9_9FIRM|nr:MFS transporter [Desulfuribacillus alkaliarsenatis]OEF96290.1 hypothetical protein BHF68_09005 [Desulfuribacillus alkaliarsenatis]